MTRSDRKAGNSKLLRKVLSTLLILCMAIGYLPAANVFAEDGETPQPPNPVKHRIPNGDGTYKLSLSVTGDSEVRKEASDVNVLIMYDTSTSMCRYWVRSDTGYYGTTDEYWSANDFDSDNGPTVGDNTTVFKLYKYVSGSFVALSQGETYTGTVYRRSSTQHTYYFETDSTTGELYGYYQNQYVRVYYNNGTFYRTRTGNNQYRDPYDGTVYTRVRANYEEFNGDRVTRRRADVSEKAVYDLIHALFTYQNDDKTNLNVSMMTFDSTGQPLQTWTTRESDLTNELSSTGVSKELDYHSGTNYEGALNTIINELRTVPNPDAPTFVLFFTDGSPSQEGTTNPGPVGNQTTYQGHAVASYEEAYAIQSRANTTLYGIYAFGDDYDFLDDVMYYANTGHARPASEGGVSAQTVDTSNYYNAGNTEELNSAIEHIFSQIVQAFGITSVSVNDGTTSSVEAASGQISHLLEVDESSYEYWLELPLINNTFTKTDMVSGTDITYTVTDNHDGTVTLSWGDSNTLTLTGSTTLSTAKVKWTSANAFYNVTPPAARFVASESAVKWDLVDTNGNPFTLLDGVTYTVSFDVYPSQDTYDAIAQIRNEETAADREALYNTLISSAGRQYLKPTDDEYTDFSLETNTGASLQYTDTRDPNPQPYTDSFVFTDPPIPTTASQLTVKKDWDPVGEATDITMTVTRDGLDYYDIHLTSDNHYTDVANISTGLLRQTVDSTGLITSVRVLDKGHDYGFSEMDDNSYYWDLDVQTVRPMLINSSEHISTLVLIEDDADIRTAMGSKIFLQQGSNTYYKIDNKIYILEKSGTTGNLNATNTKRGSLTLYKDVTGDDPGTGVFNFTITVDAEFNEHIVSVTPSASEANTYTYTNKDGRTVTVSYDSAHSMYKGLDVYTYEEEVEGGGTETKQSTTVLYGAVDTTENTFTYQEAMWFSMWDYDSEAEVKGLTPAGWTEETTAGGSGTTGYYYAPSGTALTVDMTASNNIRFNYLPVGSTYTIKENSMSANYEYVSAEVKKGSDVDSTATVNDDTGTVSGTISESNIRFGVTYTNDYELTSAVITKQFVGITSDQIPEEFAITATVAEPGEDAVTKTLLLSDSDVEVSEDGLTYTWTIGELSAGTTVSATESNAAVPGYHLDSAISPESITTNRQGENKTITLTNSYTQITDDVVNKPVLNIKKVDQDNAAIPNVTFTLTDSGNAVVWTGATDAEGKIAIDFDDLEVDFGTNPAATFSYTLTESAPAGYDGAGPWSVTVKEDDGVVVEQLNQASNLYERIYNWIIGSLRPETGYDSATSTLTVTNTIHKHDITVTKTFEGIPSTLIPASYGIEIKYDDSQTVNATLSKSNAAVSADGLTLTWTLENIAFGTKISYEEKAYQVTGYEWSSEDSSSVTGEVTVNDETSTHAVSLTNKYSIKSYDVTVTKEFQGITDSTLIPSGFKVTAAVNGTSQDLTVSGQTPVSTANGLEYTWTIEDVPFGTEIAFDESGTAIDGYTLGTVTWSDSSKKLTVSADETANQFAIVNPYTLDTGKLIITKALSADSEAVTIPPNTQFTVTGPEYPSGHAFAYSEFRDGSLVLDGIRAGDYTVSESADSAKVQGYDLTVTYDPAGGSATVPRDGEATVAVTNKYVKKTSTDTQHSSVTVTKIDQDNQPLDGASFAIKDGSTSVLTFTAGTATISTSASELAAYLPSTNGGTKTLKLVETEAPEGYQKDETEYDVVLGTSISEELINDVFVTTTTCCIKIVVNSAENTSISDKNTKITRNDTVDDSITVNKVDQDRVALSGAAFTLYDGEASLAVYDTQSFTISTDDAALADKLPDSGSSVQFTLRETTVPQGYTGDTADHTVAISASSEEALTDGVWVTTKTYTITIDGAETKNIVNTKKTGTDTQHNSITITKTDGTNQISGATFEILSGETVIKEFSAGEYTISTSDDYLADYLPAVGETTTLTFVETDSPEGYELDSTPHTITLGASSSEAYDSGQDMFITTTTYTISVDLSSITNLKITDTARVDNSVTINKVDENGEALTGAVFTLYSGEQVITTYQAGTATISTADSALADYLPDVGGTTELDLKETQAPAGYDGDTGTHTVSISASQNEALTNGVFVTTTTYYITVDGEDSVNIENVKRTGEARVDTDITVDKVDGDDVALQGASFAITTVGDEPVTVKTFTAGSAVISTEDEEFADYLPAAGESASFILKETEAPDGYRMDESEYSVTISASQNESLDTTENKWITTTTYTIKVANETAKTITNTKITGSETVHTAIELTKVDSESSDSALAGAQFVLSTGGENGGTVINTYTTGRDGKIVISTESAALTDYLPTVDTPTVLVLTEEKAPVGYEAGNTVHALMITAEESDEVLTNHVFVTTTTYTISVDGQTETAQITNEKITGEDRVDSEITITKVDEDGETINGATFELSTAEGETIAEFNGGSFKISTADESLEDYLPAPAGDPVELILRETAAPTGYMTDDAEYTITISAKSEEALDLNRGENGVFVTTTTYTILINGENSIDVTNWMIFGDLEIVKDLTSYEVSGSVSFVFSVTATLDDKVVFDDVYGLTFDEAGSKSIYIIDEIPVGAKVVVQEIYGGAGYKVNSDARIETTIVPRYTDDSESPGITTVVFENRYDDSLKQGFGIVNKFEYTEDGWTYDNEGDSETLILPVEPQVQ